MDDDGMSTSQTQHRLSRVDRLFDTFGEQQLTLKQHVRYFNDPYIFFYWNPIVVQSDKAFGLWYCSCRRMSPFKILPNAWNSWKMLTAETLKHWMSSRYVVVTYAWDACPRMCSPMLWREHATDQSLFALELQIASRLSGSSPVYNRGICRIQKVPLQV